jgi:hypothetical protein
VPWHRSLSFRGHDSWRTGAPGANEAGHLCSGSRLLILLLRLLPLCSPSLATRVQLLLESLPVLLHELSRHLATVHHVVCCFLPHSGLLLGDLHGLEARVHLVLVVEGHPLLLGDAVESAVATNACGVVFHVGFGHLHVIREGLA